MKIWFDMDGTVADLYGVTDWLADLQAENTRPYEMAKGIGNLSLIARLLNKVQADGHEIGIISWTSRTGSAEYNDKVAEAKREWLHKHFRSVTWNEIKVVAYGTNKLVATGGGILFDDEEGNRNTWGTGAHKPEEIIETLKKILAEG